MTHGVRTQVTKLDNLSLILRTHMGQRKLTPDICPPTSTSSSRTHATYLIETENVGVKGEKSRSPGLALERSRAAILHYVLLFTRCSVLLACRRGFKLQSRYRHLCHSGLRFRPPRFALSSTAVSKLKSVLSRWLQLRVLTGLSCGDVKCVFDLSSGLKG